MAYQFNKLGRDGALQITYACASTSVPVRRTSACLRAHELAPSKRLHVQATCTKTAPVTALVALHLPPRIYMSQQQLGRADL